jgi:cbb3-type cytochrome oxidase cytochrome c subunit
LHNPLNKERQKMAILDKHKIIETNATLLLILSFLVVTIGGLVQIVPLFYLDNTIEEVEGVRPYSPLELTGRDIYYPRRVLCLSQPDDPPNARRSGTLWPLFIGGRIHV